MTMQQASRNLRIRDKIKFEVRGKTANKPVIRMVKRVQVRALGSNYIEVEYSGQIDFKVRLNEIKQILRRVRAFESGKELGIKEGKDYWVEKREGQMLKLQGVNQMIPEEFFN